jgi:hypothetical protein
MNRDKEMERMETTDHKGDRWKERQKGRERDEVDRDS